MVTWSTERFRSAMISSRSRYVREYRRYQRTRRRMITSSKCRPRNSGGRLQVTLHRTKSAQAAFATEPVRSLRNAKLVAPDDGWRLRIIVRMLGTVAHRPLLRPYD